MANKSSIPRLLVACGTAILALAATQATLADPATLVSFTWSATGEGQATAASSCPCQPPQPPYCDPTLTCDGGGAFSLAGSAMEPIDLVLESRRSCGAGCTCSLTVAGGEGVAIATPRIGFTTSPDLLSWTVGASISAIVGTGWANGATTCVDGSSTAASHADHAWEIVFDLAATATRVNLATIHVVSIDRTGDATTVSTSDMTLTGPSGSVLYSRTLSRVANGFEDGSETFEAVLPPGRYTFRITSSVDSAADAPPESAGSANADARAALTISRYDCPTIDAHPESVATCPPGGSPRFLVTASGTEAQHQWRRNGLDLADGPTGTGSTIAGANFYALTINNASAADEGAYDCLVSNACNQVDSNDATLTVGLDGDADSDGTVDFGDVTSVLANFGNTYAPATGPGDADGNGLVNFADITSVLAAFGSSC